MAAGRGRRTGEKIPKQFIPLKGKPLFLWSAEKFLNFPEIENLILVVPRGWEKKIKETLTSLSLEKIGKVVEGGKERQDSVREGLKWVKDTTEGVLIHDAARPFVSFNLIKKVIEELKNTEAVVPGIEVRETIKWVEEGWIKETLPRENLWLIQTPQGFRKDLILLAYQRAEAQGWKAKDDATLVEKLGKRVKLVEGEEGNLKITFPFDFKLGEWLIENLGSGS